MSPLDAAWQLLKEEPVNETLQDMMGDENPDSSLSQAMAAARMRQRKPLNLQKLPAMEPMSTGSEQTTLPPELTIGATVGTKDFRNVKFPNFSGR